MKAPCCRRQRLNCVFFCFIVAASPLCATDQVEGIILSMIQREAELFKNREQFFCEIREKTEVLDEDGRVTSTSWKSWNPCATTQNRYGVEDAHRLSGGKLEVSQEEPFSILTVMGHFSLQRVEDEVVDGILCYRINFSPKGGQSYETREEKVANELEGTLWIAQTDYSLVKNIGHLTKPVSVAWFFAYVEEVEFSFDSQNLPNGERGPKTIEYRFRAEVPPFLTFHERHTRGTRYSRLADGLVPHPSPSSIGEVK